MKIKIALIVLIIIALFAGPGCPESKYKPAPDPKYSKEKGYGWSEEVPVDKPSNVWNVLKEWRSDPNRYIFVDQTKNGECDNVFEWRGTGEIDEKGRDLYTFHGAVGCDMMENYINNIFLPSRKK